MNYIDLLTQEEKSTLCEIITGREFKELFKRNEQEFSRIRKGFRAKSLTEQQALSIAIVNIDKPFITMCVNTRVDIWLKEIQENMEKLEREGSTHDIALATTMLDSVFSNNVDLYLKLGGKTLDVDAHSKLHERMEGIKSERTRNTEVTNRIKVMEEEKRHLLDQIEAAQQSSNTIKAEYERKIQKIEHDKDTLESLLAEAQERITELQTATTADRSENADYLAQFDDTDTSILPSVGSDEIVSLCGVVSDYNGQKWLIRYADLSYDRRYYVFHKREDASAMSTNWNKIFHKNGPSNDGFYGIWTWSATPNEKNPSKDYILSRYNMDLDAIEVVTISEASNLDNLINLLKNGIECQLHSRRVMFAFYASKGQYMGILCNTKELNTVNGKTAFAEHCIEVPVYEFTKGDILRLDNGLSFYRNAFAGRPSKLYHLKSPLEIVKNIVFSSISWTAYKTRGLIRTEYRAFKDFLSAIPVNDITGKIETACHCSNSAAKELLDEFLNAVWKYVDGDSLEDGIILSAISASTELRERTKALIRTDWEAENKSLLDEAQKKLDSLDSQLKSASVRLTEAQEAFNQTRSEEERLTAIIAEEEKLAEDVEVAVAERIQKARENAADFIANMAFVGGQPIQVADSETPAAVEDASKSVITPYHTFSSFEGLNDLEAHHSWADVINSAAFELGEAGVAEKCRSGLAAFLCAAYIEKQPILLVGPNAIDIVLAFSAAVSGHKYGMLCCEGSYSNQVIAEIGTDGEDIVIINNLLASGWMNRLPEILSQKDIFYVATHPYAEDIQVEPKSLYGFMLPLFTEFFVDKKSSGKYYGGYFAEDFKTYSAPKGTRKDLRILSKLKIGSLVRNRINRLVATMHGIYSAATADEDFLYAVLPIAYIYLYDSLSSGAGYAVSVADAIAELLSDMKELLSSCDCGSACSKCLKHYRNQYVHGMLDRFAALQLLEWGVAGIKASPIKPETQINMIMPLANILKQSGCEITADNEITATGRRSKKKVVIYPAMWVEPHAANTIFVSDAYIKYAKPYAVQKILDNL